MQKKMLTISIVGLLSLALMACGNNAKSESPTDEDVIAIESLETVTSSNQTMAEDLALSNAGQEEVENRLNILKEESIPTLEEMHTLTLSNKTLTQAFKGLADEALADAKELEETLETMQAGDVSEETLKSLIASTKETNKKVGELINPKA